MSNMRNIAFMTLHAQVCESVNLLKYHFDKKPKTCFYCKIFLNKPDKLYLSDMMIGKYKVTFSSPKENETLQTQLLRFVFDMYEYICNFTLLDLSASSRAITITPTSQNMDFKPLIISVVCRLFNCLSKTAARVHCRE